MYLWLIIATFVTAIYAVSQSFRSDIDKLYVEPQAQVVTTKLYVQHEAAKTYMMTNISNATDASGAPTYKPTFEMGKIDINGAGAGSLKSLGYLPYGFEADSGGTNFDSLVYCLDKSDATKVPDDCAMGTIDCCQADDARIYLVSFGCVPNKWKNMLTGKPLPKLLGAMKTTYGFLNGLGYVVDEDEVTFDASLKTITSSMGIWGQGDRYYIPIPQYITSTQISGVGVESFSTVCGENRTVPNPSNPSGPPIEYGCDYCLVYMTPF